MITFAARFSGTGLAFRGFRVESGRGEGVRLRLFRSFFGTIFDKGSLTDWHQEEKFFFRKSKNIVIYTSSIPEERIGVDAFRAKAQIIYTG